MSKEVNLRVKSSISCRDTDYIAKVPDAGSITTTVGMDRVQIMHNGLMVLADLYYDSFISEIIAGLNGHHEPQEEKVFHEVLKYIQPKATMLELGAYWSYYSLWFQSSVNIPTNYMVEPIAENIKVGEKNFELNNKKGSFIEAFIGSNVDNNTVPKTITVDYIIESEKIEFIDILHSDIQGYEYEMLLGAKKAIQRKQILFVFISTHGLRIHYKCLNFLKENNFFIIASHTPYESYSCDGLIVATSDSKFSKKISISKKKLSPLLSIKSFVGRFF